MKILLLFLLIINGFYGAIVDVDPLTLSSLIKLIFKSNEFHLSNCSANFVLRSNSSVYEKTKPIKVTFESKSFDRTFRDLIFYVEDQQGHFVGEWKSDNAQLLSLSNRAIVDISQRSKTQVQALWYPGSDLIGDVSIKAIAVENNSMLLIDCYKIQVKPGIKEFTDDSSSTTSSLQRETSATSPTVDVAMNVTWTFDPKTKVTHVLMTIINLKSAEWAAIGLGTERAMGRAHVFLCKRLADDTITVSRYINPSGHQYPEPAPSDAGGLFTPGQQRFHDGIVTCQFTLSDFTETNHSDVQTVPPLSQSSLYYPLFAVGLLDSDNDPQRHPKDSRKAQSELVQLNKKEIILYKLSNGNTIDSRGFVRIHGTLMIITWLFLISNGILVSRYFRTIEFRGKLTSQLTWFNVHRLLMTIASISTVVSFIFIFSALQGSWIERGWTCAFVHSILGIIVIIFTFLQPFIALFRCSTTSTYRFIFNILHRTIGVLSFLLAKIVLFLATYLRQFSNPFARILMISWFIWITLIFVIFESIDYYFRRKSSISVYTTLEHNSDHQLTRVNGTSYRKASTGEKRIKLALLILHMLLAGLLSISLGLSLYFS